MTLLRLDIHDVRNISTAKLMLDSRYNIFFGPNGSGKTSLLESIYLLSTGKSFRTYETHHLISYEKPEFMLFGQLESGDEISLKREKAATKVRLNKRVCERRSELARYLPCQVFYQDIFEIINAGPQVRRGILDWGLFYSAADYHVIWSDYKRVLKQRNALLRQGCNRKQLVPWDAQFVELAYLLDTFRMEYTESWFGKFQGILSDITDINCEIVYEKGWDKKQTNAKLEDILSAQFEMDLARQYTHSGPHQADLLVKAVGCKVKQTLSRGQQKMVVIALKTAQAILLDKACLYLFDDVTTELDAEHISRFLKLIERLDGQFFFTSIEPHHFSDFFAGKEAAFFALEKGGVSRETSTR